MGRRKGTAGRRGEVTPGLTFSSPRPHAEREELKPGVGGENRRDLLVRQRQRLGGEETEVGEEQRPGQGQVPDGIQDPVLSARALPLALEGLVCISF